MKPSRPQHYEISSNTEKNPGHLKRLAVTYRSTRSAKIWIREINIFIRIRKTFTNVHKHRNPKNTKHLRLSFGSGTKLVITFLSLRFFDTRRERHNFFLCWLFHLNPTTCGTHCKLLVWPRIPSSRFESQLSRSAFQSQLTAFFQIPQILSASGHDIIHVHGPISYLWLSHPPSARVDTCAQCVHLTNSFTKRKVLSLTKPKGRIYKTKSLCNYITLLSFRL